MRDLTDMQRAMLFYLQQHGPCTAATLKKQYGRQWFQVWHNLSKKGLAWIDTKNGIDGRTLFGDLDYRLD